MKSNSNVSADVATYNEALPKREEFGLQHFTYNNSALKNVLFHHLEQTDYKGIVVSIRWHSGEYEMA